jgi:hypothetical protein
MPALARCCRKHQQTPNVRYVGIAVLKMIKVERLYSAHCRQSSLINHMMILRSI